MKASPKTYGYVLEMPNEFWPNTNSPPFLLSGHPVLGNVIQKTTAANNPDIFCKTQGSGYRLPSLGEFQSNLKSRTPGDIAQPMQPGHWSQYIDNDITKNRLPNNAARSVSGSLYNEWGDISNYTNGWVVGNYWSTEVFVANNVSYGGVIPSRGGGYGRVLFANTGAVVNPPVSGGRDDGYNQVQTNVPVLHNVACVRDLVPTPSTPTPSKS